MDQECVQTTCCSRLEWSQSAAPIWVAMQLPMRSRKRLKAAVTPMTFRIQTRVSSRTPGDGSIGVMSWNSTTKNAAGKDFIFFFGNLSVSNECIKDTSIKESISFSSRPTLGLALDIECGRDSPHMQLRSTVHLVDKSRGNRNVSSVKRQ